MQNITIGRLKEGDAQGVIKAEDGSWQLVVDLEGVPHLYVRVKIRQDDELVDGMFALDDMLPKGLTVKGLMRDGEFGGEPDGTDEELQAWYDQHRADAPVPCPR